MTKAVSKWFSALTFAVGRILLLFQLLGIGVLLLIGAMALETRDPPFDILPHQATRAQAGQWVELDLPVRRDLGRKCSVTYTRVLVDSDGSRFDLAGGGETPDGIRRIEAKNPGRLRLMLLMPPPKVDGRSGIDPGSADLITHREYVCNPVHKLWPIRSTTVARLYVQP